MTAPRVTVLMSVYNSAAYLERAVSSILGQTFIDFEFLVIDDGSTDSSRSIMDGCDDPRLRVLRTDNRGLARALHDGVLEARGDLIARMDADDIALPERLQRQVDFLDENPDVGVVDTEVQLIDLHGRLQPTRRDPSFSCPVLIPWKLLWQNVLFHPAVMVRRELVSSPDLNYDPESVTEDYDLWTRLLFHTRFGRIPEVLLHYRRSPQGMTATRGESQLASMARVHQRTLGQLLGREISVELGTTLALVSQQTCLSPEDRQPQVGEAELYEVAKETFEAFCARFHLPPPDRQALRRDLARRLLDWDFELSRCPGRKANGTGLLMRGALRWDVAVLGDRRFWRHWLARLLGTRTYLRMQSGA